MDNTKYLVAMRKTDAGIRVALEQSLSDLGGINGLIKPGAKVVLKPNINGNECITNPEIVGALIEILQDNSIPDITIAESTFGDAKNTDFFSDRTVTPNWLKSTAYN